MKEQIKIAIFGLSLNIQDSIKQKIVQMYDDTLQINWVSIGDQEMDIWWCIKKYAKKKQVEF